MWRRTATFICLITVTGPIGLTDREPEVRICVRGDLSTRGATSDKPNGLHTRLRGDSTARRATFDKYKLVGLNHVCSTACVGFCAVALW